MSTRKAQDDSVFHQCRYASAPEFERGLIANLVARRCAVLDAPADRELVWFVQYLSHQPGGLAAVAGELLTSYADRIGTRTMLKTGRSTVQNYSGDVMRSIRLELPAGMRHRFPLRGELKSEIRELRSQYDRFASQAERARALRAASEIYFSNAAECADLITSQREEKEKRERETAASQPSSYPAATLRELCRKMAVEGQAANGDAPATFNLERELAEMCLNPDWNFAAGGPWYFADLVNVLREYQQHWAAEKSKAVITAVGRKVHDTLDYTVQAGILSLLTGSASLGQSFAARQWCDAHPGQARICDVPPSNDEASFYRAIARAIGLGNFLNYKNVQIRERVEYVLQNGGICLVLNHAENLWPQKNLREAFPGRLAWLFDQVAKGASACMIAGPQFFMQQRTCEKTGWNSPEFRKKIDHLDRLPDSLSVEDVTAIARAMLPEASAKYQAAVAIYAVGQQRDLAALEAISKRAQFLAQRAGRTERTAEDVVSALKFVSGSDQLLRESFKPTPRTAARPRPLLSSDAAAEETLPAAPVAPRFTSPAPQSFVQRSTTPEPVEA